MDKGAWQATVHDVAKSVGHNLATKQQGVTKLLVSLLWLALNHPCWVSNA